MRSKNTEQLKVNEDKWSKPLMEAGWTVFPSVIVERQHAMKLDPIDINILLHLASYWWTNQNKPHPSKKTIATAMGIHPRTVQRHIAELEKNGLINRERRRMTGKGTGTNLYHLDGLIAAARPLAIEKLEYRKRKRLATTGKPDERRRSSGGKSTLFSTCESDQ